MEAAKLQTKKSIKKGKIKKSIKNVLCRPDPVLWPVVSDEYKTVIEIALKKHKVDIPSFVKPHWKELKLMPKEKRPKPSKIKKVDGLIFGISTCYSSVKNMQCTVIIMESTVNPHIIVQPVIEECVKSGVPVICIDNLRTLCAENFGVPTSCLGIKCNCLPELTTQILDVAMKYKLPKPKTMEIIESVEKMGVVDNKIESRLTEQAKQIKPSLQSPILFRTDKKSRVFVPSGQKSSPNISAFCGQEYIEFSGKLAAQEIAPKPYMKLLLKKISNNPNRQKIK